MIERLQQEIARSENAKHGCVREIASAQGFAHQAMDGAQVRARARQSGSGISVGVGDTHGRQYRIGALGDAVFDPIIVLLVVDDRIGV